MYYGPLEGEMVAGTAIWDTAPAYTYFGQRISGLGDLNGDGFNDLSVGGVENTYLFHGPLNASVNAALNAAASWSDTPNRILDVRSAGDVDGDGFSDVLTLSRPEGQNQQEVRLYRGPLTGVLDYVEPRLSMALPNFSDDSVSVPDIASVGDMDGDGVPDLAASDPLGGYEAQDAGTVFLLSGSLQGPVEPEEVNNRILGDYYFGYAGNDLASAGDVKDDGNPDLLVSNVHAPGEGYTADRAFLVLGPFSGTVLLSEEGIAIQENQRACEVNIQAQVVGAGNLNGDSYGDFRVTSACQNGLSTAQTNLILGTGI